MAGALHGFLSASGRWRIYFLGLGLHAGGRFGFLLLLVLRSLDFALVVAQFLVRDLLALQVVPGNNLVDFIFSFFCELIVAYLDLNDVRVAFE